MGAAIKAAGSLGMDTRPKVLKRATSQLSRSYRQLQRLRIMVEQAEKGSGREACLLLAMETKTSPETVH
jgi:hypothetical protein